ncbi:MAG: cupin domain-containing protein [Chloroherpetonaceae bacterium]|nr:cupin domain-containing protein [Chthonomonadaceae bacterium]MDW8208128.1 cupin domain-containing protein [Chloroherpetonaceae bacterium]
MTADFQPLIIRPGLLLDLSQAALPIRVYGWDSDRLLLAPDATHYGMVLEGQSCQIDDGQQLTFMLRPEMFFVWPGGGTIGGESSRGMVISLHGYTGLRQIGGPLERQGRLRYIDGCTDTLLVCPPRLGEPCLNHLHIPPGTDQSAHTHPSERIGVILRGRGECRTPGGIYPLYPGMGWRIPTGCLHSFFTQTEGLDVIAWHPDSDFGPTDDDHPMINRTFLRVE